MKKLLILLCLIPGLAFGATTLTHTSGSSHYQLNTLDGDYTFTDYMKVDSIEFNPGAAGEYVVLKFSAGTGETIVKLHSANGEPRVKYFGGIRMKVMYDLSASSTSGTAIIIITRTE